MAASYVRLVRVGRGARAPMPRGKDQATTEGHLEMTISRNVRRLALAVGVTLLILPAAVSDGHERTAQPQVAHHVR
jgi:hypothetical protein